MSNYNYRVGQIVEKGIYADGSLASRYFRIQSSVYGYIKNPVQTLFGYGMGNSIIPLRAGYSLAKEKYVSSYVKEVNDLGNPDYFDDSVSYEYFFVTLYLYLQFESYAFYALWLYVLAMLYSQRKLIK